MPPKHNNCSQHGGWGFSPAENSANSKAKIGGSSKSVKDSRDLKDPKDPKTVAKKTDKKK